MADLDTRGVAIVGMGLAQSIIATLRRKNILTDDEADRIFEDVLSGLEAHLPSDDPAAQQARHLVDMMAKLAIEVRLKREGQ